MSDGSVLVLGCAATTPHGRDQMRRLAEQARRRKVRLIGADTPANLPAMPPGLVDDVEAFDVHDPAAARVWSTRRAAAGRNVDAVLTFREKCVEPAAAIAEELRLAGNRPEAAHTVRTKDLCREALRAAGFRQPRCAVVPDEPAARRFLAETPPGPWIVKPRDGLGSAGVSLVDRPAGLAGAVGRLTPGVPFLVETYVPGAEFSAEGVLLGGVPTVLALTGKRTGYGFVETAHRIPAALDEATARLARSEVERALRTVGVTRGVFHVEFWVHDGAVTLGELHARPGGDFIHAMVEHTRPGLELYGSLIDDLLGEPAPPLPEQVAAAGADFLILPAGRVRAVHGWDEVLADPDLLAADLAVRPGDLVRPVRDSADRHGVLVVGGDTGQDVDASLRRLRDLLRIDVGES
jgi:biotin carboxylase